MLNVENLTLHYGHSQILYDVSIAAEVGKVTCLMGTNGVGKTSLLKAISGTHGRSGGDMTLDGQPVAKGAKAYTLAKMGVGYVPQGRDVFPLMTVRENLETGYACLDREKRKVEDEIFELFPVLQDMRNRRGGDLSGGQQQQLAIARALVAKPKLLLLDEPTEGIQPNIIKQIGDVIRYLRDQGDMAIILVEQFFDFAYDLGDEFTVLTRGEVTFSKTKAELKREELLASVSI
ncbi:urea ABC transporter ATP-binding subunit UrtE [Cognatishimia activa]|uniref:LIV-I protein F n=1 Tax=Cognatishimia activa TaxID=1715691 RepID=A0A0P1IST3_9RHOB|nr:urea ABC transporter ATP-binding subunit UrtE [Cognatishimia activa]CUI73710.1 LIV-I protein F [Cognatishimia activa]CUK26657.1 LIV-I protein F [Cognatishimia activa]